MKLYTFDEAGDDLELVPLCARRALDAAGLKLSLDGWQSLPMTTRAELAELGSGRDIDLAKVRALCATATPSARPCEAFDAPTADVMPELLISKLGNRPLDPKVWHALSPLDRYTLLKCAMAKRAARLDGAYEAIVGHSRTSTHIAPGGGVRMVDVSEKVATHRTAEATSIVEMNADAMARLVRADAPKGDVLGTARVAAIMAAKKTSELIPLCHPIGLTKVDVEIRLDEAGQRVHVLVRAETTERTGVEMEAMVAASTAALTIYDMLKAFDRGMSVGPTRLVRKLGGKSGPWTAETK